MTHCIVITGGPGSGKTSIIEYLKLLGHCTLEEQARLCIQESQLKHSEALPWSDVAGFSNILFRRIEQRVKSLDPSKRCFLDRYLIDVVAYLSIKNLPIPAFMHQSIIHNRVNSKVFFAPHWPEIYVLDEQRHETAQEAQNISNKIKELYKNYDYQIIDIPCLDIGSRARFILANTP